MPVTRTADRDHRMLAGWLLKVELVVEAVKKCLQRCEEERGDRTDVE